MTHHDDQQLTCALDASPPPIAERTPELSRLMESVGAEASGRGRRRHSWGITGLVGTFTLVGATAAVAVPLAHLSWTPDQVISYTSETSGECAISMLNTVAPSGATRTSDAEVSEAALTAVSRLDLSEVGRAGLVRELLEKLEHGNAYAIPPHLSQEYVDGLSDSELENEAVFAAIRSAVQTEFDFAGTQVDGRLTLVCDGVDQ